MDTIRRWRGERTPSASMLMRLQSDGEVEEMYGPGTGRQVRALFLRSIASVTQRPSRPEPDGEFVRVEIEDADAADFLFARIVERFEAMLDDAGYACRVSGRPA